MDYYKKFFPILTITLLPLFAHAQVYINEIMYNLSGTDTGREWVEIYNSGSNAIDLSNWKFFENNTNHGLNSISGGTSLSAGAYAIIVDDSTKFLIDWIGFSGILLDSTFSLNNTGEIISLKDDAQTIIDEITYESSTGAIGDGNSLQKSGSAWISAGPTPGSLNATVSSPGTSTTSPSTATEENATAGASSSQGSSSSASSAHYGATSVSTLEVTPSFEVNAGRDRLGTVASPLEFKAETNIDYTRNSIFVWNFGDGSEGVGEVVSHTYMYPGEYALVLNVSGQKSKAVSRVNVKIIDPKLAISYASAERIEIVNNSKNEANLFGRALVVRDKVFTFPKDTIIKAGQKISFGANATGLYPKTSHDVMILILGENNGSTNIAARIEKQKLEQIISISTELAGLQNKLTELTGGEKVAPAPTFTESEIGAPTENVEVENEGEKEMVAEVHETQTALVLDATTGVKSSRIRDWFTVIKKFFLGEFKIK